MRQLILTSALVAALAAPAAAETLDASTPSGGGDAPVQAGSHAQPAAPDAEIQLLCDGIAIDEDVQASGESTNQATGQKTKHTITTKTERPVQFQVTVSYARKVMELRAAEFRSLREDKERPDLISSVAFRAESDAVFGTFKGGGNRLLMGVLSLGASELIRREPELYISRKTGTFRFMNASGQCRKAELDKNLF